MLPNWLFERFYFFFILIRVHTNKKKTVSKRCYIVSVIQTDVQSVPLDLGISNRMNIRGHFYSQELL